MVHASPVCLRGRVCCWCSGAGRSSSCSCAAEMGVSRATAYKWLARYRARARPGWSTAPAAAPQPAAPIRLVEAPIVALRRDRRLGPARIAAILGLTPSTVHRVLVRHGMPRLAWLDRPTGQVIRRYERARPGELVHVDVKKLGRSAPAAAGERSAATASNTDEPGTRPGSATTTSTAPSTTTPGWPTPRSTPTRLAETCAGFLRRAAAWFAAHGITIERVMTDNALAYRRSRAWRKPWPTIGAAQVHPPLPAPDQRQS